MAGGRSGDMQAGSRGRSGSSGQRAGGGSLYEQAGSAVSGMTETASELWDDAYDRGERYVRQGRRAVGRLDGVTLGGLAAAGALGFAVAWMMFANRSDGGAAWMDEPRGKRARRRQKSRQGDHRQPSHA